MGPARGCRPWAYMLPPPTPPPRAMFDRVEQVVSREKLQLSAENTDSTEEAEGGGDGEVDVDADADNEAGSEERSTVTLVSANVYMRSPDVEINDEDPPLDADGRL